MPDDVHKICRQIAEEIFEFLDDISPGDLTPDLLAEMLLAKTSVPKMVAFIEQVTKVGGYTDPLELDRIGLKALAILVEIQPGYLGLGDKPVEETKGD